MGGGGFRIYLVALSAHILASFSPKIASATGTTERIQERNDYGNNRKLPLLIQPRRRKRVLAAARSAAGRDTTDVLAKDSNGFSDP